MKRLMLATMFATLALSPTAFANGPGKGQQQKEQAQAWKAEGRHDNGLHLGQQKQARTWVRGDRLPVVYLQPSYYVRDYQTYHLVAPQPGYVWVRPYPDVETYYLVQAATGLVDQIFGQ